MTPEILLLEPNGWVPNNPRLPVLLYRGVLSPATSEEMTSSFERLFRSNGWPPLWWNFIIIIRPRTRSSALPQARRG
jgi:uncharacterized protein YjlB